MPRPRHAAGRRGWLRRTGVDIEISTDPARLDIGLVHDFLSRSYWARGRPRALVERSIRHSMCFGAYAGRAQIAFARLITDRTVFAYLADVFVVPEWRGRGVAKQLLDAVFSDPELADVRVFRLSTRDAHGLYERYGFASFDPVKAMQLVVDELDP